LAVAFDMGAHMKTTVEISGPVLERAKRVARKQKTTLRVLVEEGLDLAVARRTKPLAKTIVLSSSSLGGYTPEFENATWDQIRQLWSADRDFARFPQLKVVNPLAG
jgi:hypothetical protein